MINFTTAAMGHFQSSITDGDCHFRALKMHAKNSGCSGKYYEVSPLCLDAADLDEMQSNEGEWQGHWLQVVLGPDKGQPTSKASEPPRATSVNESGVLWVFVPEASISALSGLTVDLVTRGVNRSIEYLNPNAISECGCGMSFAVDEPASFGSLAPKGEFKDASQ